MARPADPFRTLELRRDATLEDVRTAYRRLAKLYHPDSAGERALPRFLAVQAAYEALTEGPGRLRPAIGGRQRAAPPGADRSSTRGRPPGEGPARQSPGSGPHATRGGGTSGAGARGPASGPSTGAADAAGAADRTGRASGGRTGDARGPGSAGPRQRRVRRAPGSTSYDGAESEPFEPEWEGASWYGGSSGTYWTINPREFADPRKHGPEYLARGRVGESTRGRRTRSGTARSGPGRSAERDAHTMDGPRSAAGTGWPDAAPDGRTGTTAGPAGFDRMHDASDGTRPEPGSDTAPLSWDEAGSADGATGVDAPPWSPSRDPVRSDPSASSLIAVGLLGIALAALGVVALAGSATPGATSVVPAVAFGGIGVLLLVRLLRRDGRPHA